MTSLMYPTLPALSGAITSCDRCPRLRAHCREIGRVKRREFAAEDYWARPVPGLGDPNARLLIIGLAPAAHGANRTGQLFTGDSSGSWLYEALHRFGWSNQPNSLRRGDGLVLTDCWITAAAHCAPPDNKPTREEFAACRPWLVQELALLARVRVVLALGALAWGEFLLAWAAAGGVTPAPRPRFAHGAACALPGRDSAEGNARRVTLLGSYHPSQQNTQTGRLTRPMFDAVFARARALLSEE